jgi:hypothetical protein
MHLDLSNQIRKHIRMQCGDVVPLAGILSEIEEERRRRAHTTFPRGALTRPYHRHEIRGAAALRRRPV